MKYADVNLAHYSEGMSLLVRSGIFNILGEHARPRAVTSDANFPEKHIEELSRSRGYYQALDDLLKFKEMYLQDAEPYKPLADYGGIQSLLDAGRITKEEADELRAKYAAGNGRTSDNPSA